MKEPCPQVNPPNSRNQSELMTSHNEVLIPCLGPLATSSLGPYDNNEERRSADLNFSINSTPSLSLPAPLPGVRDTQSLSKGPCQRDRGPAEAGRSPVPQKTPSDNLVKGGKEAIRVQLLRTNVNLTEFTETKVFLAFWTHRSTWTR